MKTRKIMLITVAILVASGTALAQTATEIQQQKTEAATADQAGRTNAAAEAQSQRTQAATAVQAARTQAATQQQAQRTQTASQKQAEETAAAVQRQNGQPQLYVNQPVTTSGAIIYGIGSAASTAVEASNPPLYNTSPPAKPVPGEKALQDVFSNIDTNHDGFITKTEFSMYYKTTLEDARFDSYDTNRDDLLSYYEFRAPNVSAGNYNIPR